MVERGIVTPLMVFEPPLHPKYYEDVYSGARHHPIRPRHQRGGTCIIVLLFEFQGRCTHATLVTRLFQKSNL